MAFKWRWWRNVDTSTSGAGSRPDGLQITTPLAYSADAADPVTIDTAFQISVVWACVKLLSETIGSMPIKVYNVNEQGIRTRNFDHPVAKLFSGKLNKWNTRIEFIETMTMQLVLQGNCYAIKQKNALGNIIGLMPLMSQNMEVALTEENGDIYYKYSRDGGQAKEYSQDEILQVRGMGNGIVGLSALGYARNSLGIAQASEKSVTKIYSNGSKPTGVLTIDRVLKDDQRGAVKKNFEDLASGTDDRLLVLEAGMQYHQVSMTPQDVELLSTRKFQIEDLARFFGVPSVMINDTSATTVWGSGIQQIVEGFYKLGVRPYLERYEEAFKIWLLKPEEREKIVIEFDFQEFLRPDQSARLKMYGEAISKGIMTPNEARAQEGWEALPGGEKAFMQQQMIPLDMLGKVQLSTSTSTPTTAEESEKQLKAMLEAVTHREPPSITVNMPEIKMPDVHVPEIKLPAIEIPQPIINFSPEMKVDVATPEVIVRNEVQTPVVNVPAPIVHVAAPNVKVDAPAVSVTPKIEVKLPRRKTTTKVTYDRADRIDTTTQIEEDA